MAEIISNKSRTRAHTELYSAGPHNLELPLDLLCQVETNAQWAKKI